MLHQARLRKEFKRLEKVPCLRACAHINCTSTFLPPALPSGFTPTDGSPSTASPLLPAAAMCVCQDPVAHISAQPSESNILEWHYLIHGPPSSPYHSGLYHGKLVFPRDYPYRPPAIYMLTPNGRFKTNTKLCLSMSDFHPETWNPLWSVSSILQGLLSFMIEDTATSDTQRTDSTQAGMSGW